MCSYRGPRRQVCVDIEDPADRYVAIEDPADRYIAIEDPADRYIAIEDPADRYVDIEDPADRSVSTTPLPTYASIRGYVGIGLTPWVYLWII